MSIQLGQIVEILGGKLHGDAAREIKGLEKKNIKAKIKNNAKTQKD